MTSLKHTLLSFSLLVFSNVATAQETHSTSNHHEHHNHEIGMGNSAVVLLTEEEITYGMHLHYIYNIPASKLGLGLGYERIFDEHKHNAVGVIFSYRPLEMLSFSLMPGISFESGEIENSSPALHFETAYEFEFEDFHIGPVLEFAVDRKDTHLGLGIHIGVGF